jgi:hypothetical protein
MVRQAIEPVQENSTGDTGYVEKDAEKIIVPALEAFKDSDTLVIATTGGSRTKELQAKYAFHNIIRRGFHSIC